MSKYKVKFYVSTHYVNSACEETIDLVDDYGYSENKAKKIFKEKDEKTLTKIFEEWVWENLDTGYLKLGDDEE